MILYFLSYRKAGETVKRKRRKKMSPITILGVIILTVTICGTVFYKQYRLKVREQEYTTELQSLEREKEELEQQKDKIEEFSKYIKTDEYVESIAREKFGLVYPGEILFIPEDED